MKRRATLVHLNAYGGITPLVGGYLKTYAEADPVVAANWDIDLLTGTTAMSASRLIHDIVAAKPDVVGFSAYVWNIGLVQRVLRALVGLMPQATRFVLGGVQVMHQAAQYVDPRWENIVVANGEGEITFRELLSAWTGDDDRDLVGVEGVSFYRDGELVTRPNHPRIRDLSLIPSPFLAGVFDDAQLQIALIETNRGCPYRCEYCFWGGAIGQKVHRQSAERVEAEIDYLAARHTKTLFICDANFGIFDVDAQIAEMIVKARQRGGYPARVVYSSAKNNTERVEAVARIFVQGDVLSNHPISLQTMDVGALKTARRGNIGTETYVALQRRLNQWGVASFLEMIWPMPSETLETMKDGVDQLCEVGAQTFSAYPLLWLNNVGFADKKDALGVVTLAEDDPAGGAEIVIQTKDVTFDQYVDGLRFYNSVNLLHDCRGLYLTVHLLHRLKLASFREVFDRFTTWMQAQSSSPVVQLWRRGQRHFEDMIKYSWRGAMVEAALHDMRGECDALFFAFGAMLREAFVGHGEPWQVDLLAAVTEADLLARPYMYVNTPCGCATPLERLHIDEVTTSGYRVESPYDFARITRAIEHGEPLDSDALHAGRFRQQIDHSRGLIFRMPNKPDDDHRLYAFQFHREIGNHLARWSNLDEPTP